MCHLNDPIRATESLIWHVWPLLHKFNTLTLNLCHVVSDFDNKVWSLVFYVTNLWRYLPVNSQLPILCSPPCKLGLGLTYSFLSSLCPNGTLSVCGACRPHTLPCHYHRKLSSACLVQHSLSWLVVWRQTGALPRFDRTVAMALTWTKLLFLRRLGCRGTPFPTLMAARCLNHDANDQVIWLAELSKCM